MAISLKNLEYHPKVLDNGINESEEFGEGDEKFSLNISMPSPFSGMPENYFDWPEAKIVANYWTKECTDELEKETKDSDFVVLGNSFHKKMKEIIGDQEYKELLGVLKQAKEKYTAEGLWIHGYTTPPIYFAEAISAVLKSGGNLEYKTKSNNNFINISNIPSIKHSSIEHGQINPPLTAEQDLSSVKKCVACKIGEMSPKTEKVFFGLFSRDGIICDKCGATFRKSENGYKFVKTNDQNSNVWKEYGRQILSAREWVNIGNGGMSDQKQRVADIEQWLGKLSAGTMKISFKGVDTPVIVKSDEELLFALPGVTLKEPRAIRKSSGGYAGPSFRVAKGVYFRMGRFGSTSESHQEIRNIDQGVLTITSERLVFSGGMKTINLDLRKIVQVDPFTDGLALHKEGREKTQYFLWNENIGKMTLSEGGRSYSEPLNGMIVKCVMEGAIRNFNKPRR
jgi:hypothetical protein